MAVAADGRSIKIEDKTSGQSVVSTSRRRAPPARSWSFWLFNNAAKLTIWYAIITVLFRCPSESSSLIDSSPKLCRPYLTTRKVVQPYVQPYYDKYASPLVETAKPYADQLNTRVIKPASSVTSHNYQKYAAPQLNKARRSIAAQWERALMPQFLLVQNRAQDLYAANLAPHVEKASAVAGPYYETAKDNALNVHEKHIIPALDYSKPHLENIYSKTQVFVLGTAVPFMHHAWTHVLIFIDGTLWPFVKGVYRNNVRPQLVMISERIAKYQEGHHMQVTMDEADSSIKAFSQISSDTTTTRLASPTIITTKSGVEDVNYATDIAVETPTAPTMSFEAVSSTISPAMDERPVVATDETIGSDLVEWQRKFAAAADEGSDDLRERVGSLIDGLVKSDLESEGAGLASALEKQSTVGLDKVKSTIITLVKSLPDNANSADLKKAEDDVMQTIREAGVAIKEKATKVREYTSEFKMRVKERATLAADSTLQVLDGIRDLGLQEIGMRWAWMDGVTYKHWAKYHDLKKTFEDWRKEVRDVAINHTAIEAANNAADKIMEESMAVTEEAAKELIRLREVAKWKIQAKDDTDNFESRAMPAAAISAASSLASELQDVTSSLFGSSQGNVESVSSVASDTATDAANSVSSVASGATGSAESIVSHVSSSIVDMASDASSAVVGSSTGTTESLLSSASSMGSSVVESMTDSGSSIASAATILPSDGVTSTVSSMSDVVSGSVKSAYSGVKDAGSSASIQSMINQAGDRVAEVTASLLAEQV